MSAFWRRPRKPPRKLSALIRSMPLPIGVYKLEDIEACETAGIVPHVPRPQRGVAVREDLFRKDEFRYDATSDTYLCPAGQRLEPRYHSTAARNLTKVDYCNREACRVCPLRPRCTHNSYRRVTRLENADLRHGSAARSHTGQGRRRSVSLIRNHLR